jgi:hypothetical protein
MKMFIRQKLLRTKKTLIYPKAYTFRRRIERSFGNSLRNDYTISYNFLKSNIGISLEDKIRDGYYLKNLDKELTLIDTSDYVKEIEQCCLVDIHKIGKKKLSLTTHLLKISDKEFREIRKRLEETTKKSKSIEPAINKKNFKSDLKNKKGLTIREKLNRALNKYWNAPADEEDILSQEESLPPISIILPSAEDESQESNQANPEYLDHGMSNNNQNSANAINNKIIADDKNQKIKQLDKAKFNKSDKPETNKMIADKNEINEDKIIVPSNYNTRDANMLDIEMKKEDEEEAKEKEEIKE